MTLPIEVTALLAARSLAKKAGIPAPEASQDMLSGMTRWQSFLYAGSLLAQDHPFFFYVGLIGLPPALVRYGYALFS